MKETRALPVAIARLVQNQTHVDIEGELRALLEEGNRRVSIGIGPTVDIPLLDEELHAAEIAEMDRELVVCTVMAEPDGYVVERGWSNFGLYTWSDKDPIWNSVPWMGLVRSLRPGDKVAMGSTPAEALQFVLPESPLVPPRVHRRSLRKEQASKPKPKDPEPDRRTLRATPRPGQTPGPAAPRTPGGSSPRPAPLRVDADRYQARFDVAIRHWRYAMITIGADPASVVVLDDPDLSTLRAAIGRNLEQPDRGYELFVKDPTPELWVQPANGAAKLLARGDVIKLRGSGSRIGFAGYVVNLPDPAMPSPRFGPRQVPTGAEIAGVLGLDEVDLDEADRVKAAYRDLARRFHPDRHDGEPGHVSRFLELQVCFNAWKKARE
jgi:hypothetical protein